MYDLRIDITLGKLLEKAQDDATLLIPDLQRPFKWEPLQVLRLIDSLLRGWPFGALLMWDVDKKKDGGIGIPYRTFWKVIDRVENLDKSHSLLANTTQYSMVLDGQQRIQSLILAFGSDTNGYKLTDKKWADYLERERPRGRNIKNQWSAAQLCINVKAFLQQCIDEDKEIRDIDYYKIKKNEQDNFHTVLDWIILDTTPNIGISEKKTCPSPLHSKNSGSFIRLAILWKNADERCTIKDYSRKLPDIYKNCGITNKKEIEGLNKHLPMLLEIIGKIKANKILCQHLVSYEQSPYKIKNEINIYNNAIVQIFTRLNSGGTPLTQQEITFAWIKKKWAEIDNARNVDKEFENLKNKSNCFIKTIDELVFTVSILWSVFFKENGELLNDSDLLNGDIISKMAENIHSIWSSIEGSIIDTCEIIKGQNLERSNKMLNSLYAINLLIAWSIIPDVWKRRYKIKGRDSIRYDKTIEELINKYAYRWLIISSWGGLWQDSPRKNLQKHILDISNLWNIIKDEKEIELVFSKFEQVMKNWIFAVSEKAKNYIHALETEERQYISNNYYFPLWVWHRLDSKRLELSEHALNIKKKRKNIFSPDVDHIISYNYWKNNSGFKESEPEFKIINSLGNMLLLQPKLNRIKQDKSMGEFLNEMFENKEIDTDLLFWYNAFFINSWFLEPKEQSNEMIKIIQKRETKIKKELIEFIEGKKELIY